MTTETKELAAVRRAAVQFASARGRLEAAIRAAEGESLRDLAAAAGVSHEQVRKIRTARAAA